MAYFLTSDAGIHRFRTMTEAKAAAKQCIDMARDACDPEWPGSVEEIAVYEAPDGCEFPDEDGRLVLIATATDHRRAKPGDLVDYWCDYAMAPPKAAAR